MIGRIVDDLDVMFVAVAFSVVVGGSKCRPSVLGSANSDSSRVH